MSNKSVVCLAGAVISILAAMPFVKDDPSRQRHLMLAAGAFAVGALAFWVYQRGMGKDKNMGSDSTKSASSVKPKNDAPLKSVWQVGNSRRSTQKQKHQSDDKPFGSKYYYAHNNPNATGGYKDGLKMEDYRMNGPRLLSKNGSSVDNLEDDEVVSGATEQDNKTQEEPTKSSSQTSSNVKISASDANVRNITKYLWDDPADTTGIATIRIDVLPDKRPGEYIDWKDVEPEDVQASLAGEGLLVKISLKTTDVTNTKYQLKIPKLYGDAADVKCVVKSKRLLVKIHKKKNSFLSTNKKLNNLDAWPQPYRKI
ncbi:MAG: hypothetical protein SGILL_002483 [Bacillariaceae sp.]